ncbi:MAG: hypothetical protein KJZ87_12785 [Thermoguttaceae bacterium]|nr:hypothetical protein [Thermoguttaceae bacterium]
MTRCITSGLHIIISVITEMYPQIVDLVKIAESHVKQGHGSCRGHRKPIRSQRRAKEDRSYSVG